MKIKLIVLTVLVSQQLTAQISVFDCQANSSHVSQSELNAVQTLNGACVKLGENQSILVSGTQNKTITATKQLHLKENVRLGSFTTGKIHLKVNTSEIDVSVMNYASLNSVSRYKKLEFGVKMPEPILARINHFLHQEGVYDDELNPFLEWNIDVEATFIHPATGTNKTIDGYYHREYVENAVTSDWDDVGTDFPFRIRFAPPLNGKWTAQVIIKVNNQTYQTSENFFFNVVESGDPGYVYVHSNKKNLMQGNRMIFPVGQNLPTPEENCIAWGGCYGQPGLGNNLWNNTYPNKAANTLDWDFYLNNVKSYFDQGGRYIRTIQSPWSSLIEFEKKGNYYDRLHYAWETDKLMDMCEQYDALVHFNMLMHTPFTIADVYGMHAFDWGNHRWINDTIRYDPTDDLPVYCYNDNPAQVGGKQPYEALSNDEDIEYHKQRTRYYLARYGYSTKIYNFELLSEPFNVGVSNVTGEKKEPYGANGTTEQQVHFQAIEKYQGALAWYIKEYMKHTEHLVGVDYTMVWKNGEPMYFDNSMYHGNVDIIGVNYYGFFNNKYLIAKDGSNNAYASDENSRARAFKEMQNWANKPIILAEFGDGDGVNKCSDYIGHYIDAMSAGFSNVCGYLFWEGKDAEQSFTWPATIRAQQHMNGDDVIATLSNGNGHWIQGRQHEKVTNNTNHANSKELQYYVSNNKERAVGYVRNRTFNAHTKRTNGNCNMLDYTNPIVNVEVYDNFDDYPINSLLDITWDDGPLNKRLKVQGLNNNTDYQIDWYSYKDGWYLKSDCQNSEGTELTLRFPKLFVTPGEVERPLVWFVIRQQSCGKSLETDLQLRTNTFDLTPSEIVVYPNPFENFVTIDSPVDDQVLILDVNGKVLFEQDITSGSNEINTSELHTGFYIIQFTSQQKQFKIVKK